MNALTNRLQAYKANAEKMTKNYPGQSADTWKNNRYPKPAILSKSSLTRSADGKQFFIDNLDDFPGSIVGDAGDIVRMDYKGWYTDNDQRDTMTGAVIAIRNPHKTDEDGAHKQYMPATYHSDWDSATVHNEFYDCKDEAARAADHYAEREADQCREFDAKDQAEQQILTLREELHDLNREALPLIKEVKGYTWKYQGPVCDAIKEKLIRIIRERSEAFEKIAKLEDNYWSAVESW